MLYISEGNSQTEIYLNDPIFISLLINENNWTENSYTGISLNAKSGQMYAGESYFYHFIDDNTPIRIPIKITPIAYSENGKFKVNCGAYVLVLPSLPGTVGQVLGINEIISSEIITNWVTISGGNISQYTASQLKSYWLATASLNSSNAFRAFDGTNDRWSTNAPMIGGEWYQIDLSQKALISSINFGENGGDSGFGSIIFSDDAITWNTLFYGISFNGLYDLASPIQARYLKFNNTKNAGLYWSIYEMNIL